ncbi:hypothetical protein O1611_g2073 [Lasiodiplodia mahajangana]|uniref:Uncharacterized protein n=1 Tax=Lasiodiplodia mahajangana TaxID=1108764 RepID=A0ACC2JVK2_9PEZI|nr:hypothetical protein O1611_g2073 [Lasiodiplodia mahajangana]
MEDTDLIARIHPFLDEDYDRAVAAIVAIPHYKPPKHPRQEVKPTSPSREDRESTEPPDTFAPKLDELPYLELRFSRGPQTSAGFVFGTASTSDFVLPNTSKIDGYYRLILRDLGSSSGTAVGYDGHGLEVRKGFDWILHGYEAPNTTKNIVIQLHEKLKFKIVANQHDIASYAYIDSVERFRRGVTAPEDLIKRFGLFTGAMTQRDSSMYSPSTRQLIAFRKKLAEGTYATVNQCWDVSTGLQYACKEPMPNKYKGKSWQNEFEIMKDLSHEHIVHIFAYTEEPVPRIYMEYMPYGDLEDAHKSAPFSYDECTIILYQTASALDYLHGRPVSIIHQNIKPTNILVQCRRPLHVKLSDFGLSKTGIPGMFCGTPGYCAPEILGVQKYTTAADIWSLGVVMLEFIWNVPVSRNAGQVGWYGKLVAQVNGETGSGGLITIARRMLVIEPTERISAAECVHSSSQLITSLQGDTGSMPPAFHAVGSELAPTEQWEGPLRLPPYAAPQPPLQTKRESPSARKRREKKIRFLTWNGISIAYMTSQKIVNITHLGKLVHLSPYQLPSFRTRHPSIQAQIVGGSHTRGTYVSLDDASIFCEDFGIDKSVLDRLSASIIMETTNDRLIDYREGSPSNRFLCNRPADPGPVAPINPPSNLPHTADSLGVNGIPGTDADRSVDHPADFSFMTQFLSEDPPFGLDPPHSLFW